MNDVLNKILLNCDIVTIMNFRQVSHIIDSLLDFNFWIDKFKYDHMMILCLKLPSKVIEWIQEYIKVRKCLYQTLDILYNKKYNHVKITNHYFNSFLKINDITELLPRCFDVSNNQLKMYIIEINLINFKIQFVGWDCDDDYVFDIEVFLMRLLYYYPKTVLITTDDEIIVRKQYTIYDL
jgi:hypothetical protein